MMHAMRRAGWRETVDALAPQVHLLDRASALVAMTALGVLMAQPWIEHAAQPWPEQAMAASPAPAANASKMPPPAADLGDGGIRETLLAGYIGAPLYYRSDLHLQRPDGTDIVLKKLGWDGDALYFPVDGGLRTVQWRGATGIMIDFLHNKAVARLGKGAHGRKLKTPVIEDADAAGTLKGLPAPPRLKLTDLFERLEFTHGHNTLIYTPLIRLASLTPGLRPYVGVGAGVAVPHVEVWFTGDDGPRTNEYQFAGPAVQLLAGLEMRVGKASYFVEWKYMHAWISASLTGEQSVSWKQSAVANHVPRWLLEPFVGLMELPGDLARQAARWWRGESRKHGGFTTTLGAHTIVIGGGYWWDRTPPQQP